MRKHFVLTAISLKTLKPGRHADGGNLYIDVKPNGQRYWTYRYKMPGQKLREMGLGPAGEGKGAVSLKEARDRAAALRQLQRDGIDPLSQKKAVAEARNAERQAAQIAAITFEQVAEQYLALHSPKWENEKHRSQWHSTLKTYVFPKIGRIPIQQVTKADVLNIIQPIWLTKTETANRIRNRIELIIDFAKAKDLRTGDNPASWRGNLSAVLPPPGKVRKVRHHPALPWKDLPDFYNRLSQQDGIGAFALRFLILTALRTGTVIKARWGQIDFEHGLWVIPAKSMKARRDFVVPLSAEALTVLGRMDALRLSASDDELIFSVGGRPMSNMTMAAVLKRMNMIDVTVHGFRSTFRDWIAARTDFTREVAKKAMAHAVADKTEAAYYRDEVLEKRTVLMSSWADYCTSETAKLLTRLKVV